MKQYNIFYSGTALADLDRVWDEVYIVSCDLDIADEYISGIRNALRQLSKRPKTGIPLIYDNIFTGIYMVVYKKYIAFYRIRKNRLEVGRILLGSSDYMRVILNSMNIDLEG